MSSHLRAFRSAILEVEWMGRTWVGAPEGQGDVDVAHHLPGFLETRAIVLTACNPKGVEVNAKENSRLTNSLEADLKGMGHAYFSCIGRDTAGVHSEKSFWIQTADLTSDQAILNLAAKYQQLAVFVIEGQNRVLKLMESEEEFDQKLEWRLVTNPNLGDKIR